MADTDVRIVLTLDGASAVQRGLTGVGSSAEEANTRLQGLSKVGLLGVDAALVGLKVSAAATAGVITTGLVKGIKRLTNIDTATNKLKALGNSAEDVEQIMQMANRAVTDTAFGLDEAAGAAGALAAAKVPLSGIEDALTSMSGVAGVAGVSMGEMGDIFAKVAANQKLDGQVVASLLAKQVPILQMIQDHYGITGEEAKKMVSDGKISFEDFIEITGQLGDAAKVMGESFEGQLSNVNAAIGRSGAIIEGPFFEALKSILTPIKEVINAFNGTTNEAGEMTGVLTPLASLLNDRLAPAAERFGEILSSIARSGVFNIGTDGAKSFASSLAPLLPLLGGVAGLAGPMLAQFPLIGPIFSGLTGPVGLFAGSLLMLTAIKPETLLKGFDSLADSLPGMLEGLIGMVADMLPKMLTRITENSSIFITGVLNIITSLIPVIADAIPMLAASFANLIPQLITTLLDAIPALLDAGLNLFSSLVDAVVKVVPLVLMSVIRMIPKIATALIDALPAIMEAGLTLFEGLASGITESLPVLIDSIFRLLPVLLDTVLSALPLLIEAGLNLFLGLAVGILKALPDIITTVIGLVPKIITALLGMIPSLISAGLDLFVALVAALPEIITEIVAVIPDIITSIVDAVLNALPQLIDAGIELFLGLIDDLPFIITTIVGAIPEIILAVVTAVGKALPQLIKAGFDLLTGLVGNIGGIVSKVVGAIPQIIIGLLKAIKSAGNSLVDAGYDLIVGMWEGISNAGSWLYDKVMGWAGGLVDGIKDFFGIASPSKLFEEEIGQMLPPGIGRGVDKATPQAIKPLKTMSQAMLDEVKSLPELSLKATVSSASIRADNVSSWSSGPPPWAIASQASAQASPQLALPQSLVLRVGEREIEAWIDERADSRISAAIPPRSFIRQSFPV